MGSGPGRLTLSEEDRRVLAGWAADGAERVLYLFEAHAPADTRPRDAIEGARTFARGELRIGPARSLAIASHAAAQEVGEPAAVAAARAAGHACATAHMGSHARGVPAYAAIAAGLASAADPGAADEEFRRQVDLASPAVREILARLPPPPTGGELGRRIAALHAIVTGP